MREKDFTYLAEGMKRGIDNEIAYIYSCFVPAGTRDVLARMKGNVAVADREFLDDKTRATVGNRWTCSYDLLVDRVERQIEAFYAELDLSSETIAKLSQYQERAEVFKSQFRENLEKSEETTKKQLLRELELMVMQGKDVKTLIRHMNTAVDKRIDAVKSFLTSSAGQMERYMLLWDYQDGGYTQYRLITVGDNCEHCTELNGKVFDIHNASYFTPLHPNCNCRAEILDNDGNSVATLQEKDTGDKLDYLRTSLKQIILGNYTEDTNLLGTMGQVALGFLGLDLPADMRDLLYDITNWKLTPSHALQTILDAAALLPVVGSIKYSDEAADAVKGVAKYQKLSNVDARRWYLEQEAKIPDLIDTNLPMEEQAKMAFKLRNQYRTQAREMMEDRQLAELLYKTEPNITWEQIVQKQIDKGLVGDEIFKGIIESSQRSRESVNDLLGLDRRKK